MPIFETHDGISSNINTNANPNANTNTTTDSNTDGSPSPPYSVPFTVALLISEGLFLNNYSPVSSLIIPFIRADIPYGYMIIIIMEFITALLVKMSYGPAYSILSQNTNTAVPDMSAIRQIYSSASAGQTASGQSGRRQPGKVSAQSTDTTTAAPNEETPLFPKGLTFNISFSAPFSSPNSKTSTLYAVELKEIKNVPGYVLPLASLILYFVLQPYFRARDSQNRTTSR